MTRKAAATMTYSSNTVDTGTQAGSPIVVRSDCRGEPSDKETQTADDTIIENRPENQANNMVPVVEEPFIKEEILTDESLANLAKFAWDAVPKVASAIAIANDYINGGVTKNIADNSTDVVRKGVEKTKENIHKLIEN